MPTSRPQPGPRSTVELVPIRAFRTPVRGHAFASPPPETDAGEIGEAELAREPGNPADPLAVAVWARAPHGRSWRVGYLDRGVAARLAPRIDAGLRVSARLDGWSAEPGGRWQRPLLLLLPEASPDVPAPVSQEAPCRVWGRQPGVRRRRVS